MSKPREARANLILAIRNAQAALTLAERHLGNGADLAAATEFMRFGQASNAMLNLLPAAFPLLLEFVDDIDRPRREPVRQ